MQKSVNILFVGICLLISFQVKAQKMTIKMADRYFKNFAYVDAVDLYKFATQKDPDNDYLVRQIAVCYKNLGKTELVEKWLGKLVNKDSVLAADIFNYSQALKSNGKYSEAQQWLDKYAEQRPDDKRISLEKSLLEYINFLHRDSARFKVEKSGINTGLSEFSPVFYKNSIVFSSNRTKKLLVRHKNVWDGKPFLDLFISEIKKNGKLASPKKFAENVKTKYHEGPVCFNKSGTSMFVTRNSIYKGKIRKSRSGVMNLKIYVAKQVEGEWEVEYGLPFNSNEYSVGHASVDKTGTVVYFTSDMPGGYGGSDIYCSIRANKKWSKPINLGPEVNTASNESFPFISSEGVLYFSSEGHGGMGGLDIFMAIPERGEFRHVENMGFPVNSSKDDFGISFTEDGLDAYFSSNRKGKGLDDIYHLVIKQIPVMIKGVVKDGITSELIPDAMVTIFDALGEPMDSIESSPEGLFEFEVEKGKSYKLKIVKKDYNRNERPISTKAVAPNSEIFTEVFIEQDFEMLAEDLELSEPLKVIKEGIENLDVVMSENINYDTAKWDIRDDASEVLDRIAARMLEDSDLEIRLESHTDSRGSDDFNLFLSKNRAHSAFEYLVEKGIDPSRIRYRGYGETQLLNHCKNGIDCSDQEHAVNRRTIVQVVRRAKFKKKRKKNQVIYF